MVQWQSQRAKVQLKLANQRLRLSVEKKLAIAKQSRKEIADLLTKGRIETAKLRTETLIAEDISVELLELIELYTETLQARFGMLDASKEAPDASIADAVCAVVYAAPHTELKELHILREMLMFKFGRTWALSVLNNEGPCVPTRVTAKLEVYVPPAELVNAYLEEIARGYGVDWRAPVPVKGAVPTGLDLGEGEGKDGKGGDGDDDGKGGGPKEAPIEADLPAKAKTSEPPLPAAVPTASTSTPAPHTSAVPEPPAYTSDSENTLGLPSTPSEAPKKADPSADAAPAGPSLPAPPSGSVGALINETKKAIEKSKGEEDDFAALAARFDALKKR